MGAKNSKDANDTNDTNDTNEGLVEGRVILDEASNTIAVEIPAAKDTSSPQAETRRMVAQALAGMFSDGSVAATELLRKSPHDADWAGTLALTLESYGHCVNDEVLGAIKTAAATRDRETEIRLRHVLGRIFATRGEVSLGLDEIERGLSLASPDEMTYLLALQHTRANLLCMGGDASCPDACRLAIQTARALKNHQAAGNVFRIWSMFHWTRKEFDLALPLFDEAAEHLRQVDGAVYAFHLLDTLERVAWLDRSRTRRYATAILDVITCGDALTETQTAKARLSVAQHLMATAPTEEERDLALDLLVRAIAGLRKFAGLEGRAAACATLLSMEHARRGDFGLAETYRVDHDLWLAGIFDDDESLRAELSACLARGDVERLLEYEARISMHPNTGLYAAWVSAVAVVLLQRKEHELALDLLTEAERHLIANPSDHSHSDMASIFRLRAELYQALGDKQQHMIAISEVVRLQPADLEASWLLCIAALNLRSNDIAAREAVKLVAARPTEPGPYRVAGRAYARLGEYQKAVDILDRAFARFLDHEAIAAERRNAHDLRLGIAKPTRPEDGYVPAPLSDAMGPLPEVIRLPAFHREVASSLLQFVVELHRNPFRAMREQDFVEADFRDAAALWLSARWPNVHAEPVAANGFVDVVVSNEKRTESFVSEFKIWGRNDYLIATEQAIGYSGERDSAVSIVMVNTKPEDISAAYVEQLIIGHPSYVRGSFRRRPLEPRSERLAHFLSRHRDPIGRPVTVFHFICHAILAKPRKKAAKPRKVAAKSPETEPDA